MHLVYKVLDNYPLPVSLPLELLPPTQEQPARRGSTLSGSVGVMPQLISSPESKVHFLKLFCHEFENIDLFHPGYFIKRPWSAMGCQ